MKVIFYRFSLLMISLILVTGSVANASTPCCCFGKMNSQESSKEMNGDMPCHSEDMASKNNENSDNTNIGCEGCECVTCVKTSFYNINLEAKEIQFTNIQFFEKEAVYSNIYGSLYEPPKLIS